MSEFYTRRTGNTTSSILDYALPIIQLGRQIKADKKAEEDYGLRKQWEIEDRALRQKQLEENKALTADERAYQRGRDVKEDMFKQEGLDRAELKDLEANRRFDIEQKRLAANDEFNRAHQNAILKLSKQAAEYGKSNPYLGSLFKQLESYTDSYGKAIGEGNTEGATKLATQIIVLNDRVKQIMSGNNDSDMGLAQPPQRGVIPQTDINLGIKQITLPSGITKTSQALEYLKQQGMDESQALQWIRDNN